MRIAISDFQLILAQVNAHGKQWNRTPNFPEGAPRWGSLFTWRKGCLLGRPERLDLSVWLQERD